MDRHFGNLKSIIWQYLLSGKELNGDISHLFAALAKIKNTTIYHIKLDHTKEPTSYLEIPHNTELLSCDFKDRSIYGKAATAWGESKQYGYVVKKTTKRKKEEEAA